MPPPSRRGLRRRPWRSRQSDLSWLGNHDAMTALEAGPALAVGLGNSLLHAEPAAAGAGLWHRTVPGGEVARRVPETTPERLAPLGAALGEIAIGALGTLESHRDRAGALALGIRRAGQELAEPAGLDDHVGGAE